MKTDAELRQDVINELKWEPTLKAAEIGVAVKDGVVTLSGYVYSYVKKLVAERAATRIKIETHGSEVILSGSVCFWGESRSPVGGLGGTKGV